MSALLLPELRCRLVRETEAVNPSVKGSLNACAYCGRENETEAAGCWECGTEFPPLVSCEGKLPPPDDLINLQQTEEAFFWGDGFTRVDWRIVRERIGAMPREEWCEAWRQAGRQWVEQIKNDLGGHYRVQEAHNFLLLSEFSEEARNLLKFCERAEDFLLDRLGDAAWRDTYGKHVLLVFSDEDDYYQYISHFYPDGTHALSSGVCLRAGYVHLALPRLERGLRRVIAHELTHNKLAHLPIPAWLNEGLAMNFEDEIAGRHHDPFGPDSIDDLRAFWHDANIHLFWSGEGFHDPAAREHSYMMARLLVLNLAGNRKQFIEFIQHANYRDAGDLAAMNCLGIDLGDAIAPFVTADHRQPDQRFLATYFK